MQIKKPLIIKALIVSILLSHSCLVSFAADFDKYLTVAPATQMTRNFNSLNEENKFSIDTEIRFDKNKFTGAVDSTSIKAAVDELLNSSFKYKVKRSVLKNLKIVRTDSKKLREEISPESVTVNSFTDDETDNTVSVANVTLQFPVYLLPKKRLNKKLGQQEEKKENQEEILPDNDQEETPILSNKFMINDSEGNSEPPSGSEGEKPGAGAKPGDGKGPKGGKGKPKGKPGNGSDKKPGDTKDKPDNDNDGETKKPGGSKGKPGGKKAADRYKFKLLAASAALNDKWKNKIKKKIADKLNVIKTDITITIGDETVIDDNSGDNSGNNENTDENNSGDENDQGSETST